jgi:hypothetical protein
VTLNLIKPQDRTAIKRIPMDITINGRSAQKRPKLRDEKEINFKIKKIL